ncbi:MAG TPA: hypothetical protein VJS69_12685 [Candidatus Krumholzibacteria bacterium]|nr:hypothetical protein [Candidatus Krumholzibacteria bacterium]
MKHALILLVLLVLVVGAVPATAGKEYSCNMAAFSAQDLEQYRTLSENLRASLKETKELGNGYAFKLPGDALVSTSQWIAYERRCCPFFDFALELPHDGGPLWVRITGEPGVKQFIATEFDFVAHR